MDKIYISVAMSDCEQLTVSVKSIDELQGEEKLRAIDLLNENRRAEQD